MALPTSTELLKKKIEKRVIEDGNKFLQKALCVLELPFVVDEDEVKNFFNKCDGGVSSVEILRSGALVFSTALIEFNKPKGQQKAFEQAAKFVAEYDVLLVTAEDFLKGNIPTGREPSSDGKKKKDCIVQ